jgi:hypothetical protein
MQFGVHPWRGRTSLSHPRVLNQARGSEAAPISGVNKSVALVDGVGAKKLNAVLAQAQAGMGG